MELTVQEIATLVKGHVHGDASRIIQGVAGLEEATPNDITFLKDAQKAETVKQVAATLAGAILVPRRFFCDGKTCIQVDDPLAAFSSLLGLIAEEKKTKRPGINPLAFVSKNAIIGQDVTVGPFCIIEDKAVIEEGVHLVGNIYIGARSKIGSKTLIYPHVVIREDVTIGKRCIVHAGAVVGSDGYGYFFREGQHHKIPQIGGVHVEDDVEIGSCTTIDRATTGMTKIGRGTKIDNLVQIAHNVEVGPNSLLVAQVGIAGSSKIGTGVVLAGQVGVADHIKIGDRAQVGAQSGVRNDVPAGAVLFGTPAQPLKETLRQTVFLRRLSELFDDVKRLKEKMRNHD